MHCTSADYVTEVNGYQVRNIAFWGNHVNDRLYAYRTKSFSNQCLLKYLGIYVNNILYAH